MASHMSTDSSSSKPTQVLHVDNTGFSGFNLPKEFEPLSPWAYFGLTVLYSIPIVGLIFLIVFSLSDKNINRRNFSRSYFIVLLIAIVIFAVLVAFGLLTTVTEDVTSTVQSIQVPAINA